MKNEQRLHVSLATSTIIKIIVIIGVLYLLYLIADVVALLFAALIFSSAIDPWVDWLAKLRLPRSLSILLIYLALLSVIGLTVYLIIPPIISQGRELGDNLPNYLAQANIIFFNFKNYTNAHNWPLAIQNSLNNIVNDLQLASGSVIGAVSGLFGGVASFFLILVITFYMALEENSLKKAIIALVPNRRQTRTIELVNSIQQKIGWWFRGQLLLCFIVFLLTYISLSILGVKYALVLALLAGLMEIIPYFGPTLSAVPAVFLAFVQSPLLALFVLALYIIIQAVENNILVPKIMERAVGLDPIVSIAALLIGFNLGGVLGAILAIPVATALSVIVKDIFIHHKKLTT